MALAQRHKIIPVDHSSLRSVWQRRAVSKLYHPSQGHSGLTASHFMEFSGVRPPNSRMVTAESCALLKRFESDAVPKNTLPLALNALSRPVAAGAGEPVLVGGACGVVVGGAGADPGWH